MKKYDALYIFVGINKDEVLNAYLEKALQEVTKVGGTVLSTESLGKKTFMRPLKKRDNGVYVRVRMELEPAQIAVLMNRYHLVEEVFRVQFQAVDERREKKIATERARRANRASESAASVVAKGENEGA